MIGNEGGELVVISRRDLEDMSRQSGSTVEKLLLLVSRECVSGVEGYVEVDAEERLKKEEIE